MTSLACALGLSLSLAADRPPEARDALGRDVPVEDGADRSDEFRGEVLPGYEDPSDRYWVVGLAAEAFGGEPVSDQLVGVSTAFRRSALGPHVELMLDPSIDGFQQTRLLAGTGLRAFVPVLGTELSYGVGVHVEVKLDDHFWLAYATPLELGALVYGKGSWHIELFVGVRRAFAGELVDHFLVDPNGFDNEGASDELYRMKTLEPWRAFVRVVFGHRLD